MSKFVVPNLGQQTSQYLQAMPRWAAYLVLIVSGVAQTLSLAPYNFWLLGPLSICAIFLALHAFNLKHHDGKNIERVDIERGQNSALRASLYGWVFGLALFGSGASWIYVSIHVYGYASPVLAGLLTIGFVAGMALYFALMFWLYVKFSQACLMQNALLFIALWILTDAFRSYFLTGFPWLFLGNAHLESALAGWIPLLGVHGMTMLVVLSGVAMAVALLQFDTSLRARKLFTRAIFPLFVTGLLWALGPALNQIEWTKATDKTLSAAMIQTNIPQEIKWHPSQRQKTLQLLDDLSQENWDKDVIFWPETALPLLLDQALPYLDNMSQLAKHNRTNIITGIPYRHSDDETGEEILHNSIYSFGVGKGINHKQKLVPFGEYVPLQSILRGLIAFFDLPMSDFRKGGPKQELLVSKSYQVAPYICYEVVYPDFVASRAQDADYLLTISNDSWFGRSLGPLQHLEMAQMRAAENGRYMVRATNNGVSAMINEKGQIIDRSEQFVRTVLESEIRIFSGQTPFSKIGSWPLFLLCLLYVSVQLAKATKRKIKTR